MSFKRKIANFFGLVSKEEKQEQRCSCQRDSDRIISAEKKSAEASIRHRKANEKFHKQVADNETLSGQIMANLKTRKIERQEDLDEHDTTQVAGLF